MDLTGTTRCVYDGWNLIAERVTPVSGAETVTRYVWGPDLSQRVQGAGGIGGLLLQEKDDAAGQTETRLYTYEANGNVGQLVDGTTGAVVAHYEYDPFGTTLTASGTAAEANPFRFSTKYTDADTNLLYYGYRFYSPTLGRWLTRDPIEEEGGLNLYGFARNLPLSYVDPFGLDWKVRALGGVRMFLGAAGAIVGGAAAGIGGATEFGSLGTTSVGSLPVLLAGSGLAVYGADQFSTGFNELWTGEPKVSPSEMIAADVVLEIAEVDQEYEITEHLITLETALGPNAISAMAHGAGFALQKCTPYLIIIVRPVRAAEAAGTKIKPLPVPPRVRSRINIANGPTRFTPLRDSGNPFAAGWDHVKSGHFGKEVANNRSVFSVTEDVIKKILQRTDVVKSPVINNGDGTFVRYVDVGEIIGTTTLNDGGIPTSWIQIFTDRAGNLMNTYPIAPRGQ